MDVSDLFERARKKENIVSNHINSKSRRNTLSGFFFQGGFSLRVAVRTGLKHDIYHTFFGGTVYTNTLFVVSKSVLHKLLCTAYQSYHASHHNQQAELYF